MEPRIDSHPPLESLKAFGLGRMDDASAQAVFLHLEGCPACRRQAEEASGDDFLARLQKARALSGTPAPAQPLPGGAKADSWSTRPPDPKKSLASPERGMSVHLESTVSDLPPELIANSQYEVIRELGRGGMGVVYLARNKPMDRLEVLKVVNRALLDRPGTVDRFLREIRSAAALEHKNVVRAYACLQAGKLLALVMEYVVGEDLAHLVERRGPLSVSSACSSVIQAARGLQQAFKKKMVHRDIKPQNLILSLEIKEVMILDFGLAKVASEKGIDMGLTGSGQMLGTPAYMAPEQILDAAKADIRADIYSLGCTLYFLLSGRPPFHANSLYELLQAHHSTVAHPLHEERPNVPPELTAVVGRMMAKDPAHRYQTPAEVETALAPFVKAIAAAPLAIPLMPERKKTKVVAPVAGSKSKLAPPPIHGHGLSVWANLSEPEAAKESTPVRKSAPEAKPAAKRRWLLVALALLVPLGGWLAAVIFRVETPNGTLIVEIKDDEVEARIKGGKLVLTGPDGKVRYTLSAKDRSKKLDAGSYKIRVEGADGLALDTPEFTIKKGKEVKVRVTMEPKAVAKKGTPDKADTPKKGDILTNSIRMKLAYIAAGEFMMGSPEGKGEASERPRHKVKITKPFYLGIHEVTQGQFKAVMGYNPSKYSRNGTKKPGATYFVDPASGKDKIGATDDPDQYPVENVSSDEAKEYCEKLSGLEKEKEKKHLYRLPTEAEWEYACRGGPVQYKKFHFGDQLTSDDANFGGKLGRTSTVGSYKKPNKFGLHDMHGNVWEWCSDCKREYNKDDQVNPTGPPEGSDRVIRGGDWGRPAGSCSAGFRNSVDPANRSDCLGFRVALVPAKSDGVLEPKANLDPDRKAAEYVLSIGGIIRVNGEDREIKAVADVPPGPFRLTGVNLHGNTRVTDAGLAPILGTKNLTLLWLNNARVSDAGVAMFKNNKDLVALHLHATPTSDATLALFKDCKALVELNLGSTMVSDVGLAQLELGPKLTQLLLYGTKVTDAGLAHFKDCRNLTYLHLQGTKVSDVGLAYFKDCKNLTILYLSATRVSDAGLAYFKECKRLTYLDLNGTQIGDLGLAHFKDCKNLMYLGLEMTKVTAAKIAELKKALPNCKIEWDGAIVPKAVGKKDPPGKPDVPKKGDVVTNSIGMKLAYIPAGEFMMGSPDFEKPRHKVRITKAFYLGIHEVTQGQYKKVMGSNPSYFSRDGTGKNAIGRNDDPDRYPVESVSWEDATKYCEKLSGLAKEKEDKHVYRLPTEAEWEYACRGQARGASSPYQLFHFGNQFRANLGNCYLSGVGRPRMVGSYQANAFGLHDMYGNVGEWCSDWFDGGYYAVSPEDDPSGGKGSARVLRGGSFGHQPHGCRAAMRAGHDPAFRNGCNGFRVVLVPSR